MDDVTDKVRLAIIGVDGASPNIYEDFLDDLPTLRRILNKGSGGTLRSTVPPITGPAWTTMMTGKEPGKHGVFDMASPAHDYEIEPLRANKDQPMLFDHVDDSLFVNVPGTYPRRPSSEATLVHSFDCPSVDEAIPPTLSDLPTASKYLISNPKEEYNDEVSYLKRLREIESRRFDFLKQSMNELDDLEVTFTLFSSTDWALHFLSTAKSDGWESLRALYTDIDEYVSWIEDHAENLLLLSDHGFERKGTRVNLARYLHSEGYLAVNKSSDESQSVQESLLNSVTRSVSYLSNQSRIIQRAIQLAIDHVVSDDLVADARDSWHVETDWTDTRAFPVGYQGIYLNDERFAEGTDKNLSEIRDSIVTGLCDLTDQDGAPVFDDVVKRESIYDGEYVEDAPDLVCLPRKHVTCHSRLNANDTVINEIDFFDHQPNGIFSAIGPLFEEEKTITADIADIAPTILHVLDRAVPRSMDGEVINAAVVDGSSVSYTNEEPSIGPYGSTSRSDNEVVKDRLSDLGYV